MRVYFQNSQQIQNLSKLNRIRIRVLFDPQCFPTGRNWCRVDTREWLLDETKKKFSRGLNVYINSSGAVWLFSIISFENTLGMGVLESNRRCDCRALQGMWLLVAIIYGCFSKIELEIVLFFPVMLCLLRNVMIRSLRWCYSWRNI